MKMIRSLRALRLGLAISALLGCSASFAGLGDHFTSGGPDVSALQARSVAAVHASGANYTREQITLPGGGTVVEFVDAGGTIFAVSWAAPVMPDLSVLLGNYKSNFDAAQIAARQPGPNGQRVRGGGVFQSESSDWAVVSFVRPQSVHGYSYLRSKLPAGFDLAEFTK